MLSASTLYAYQLEIDYFDDITKDTVTRNGIYKRVILYIKAAPEVLSKVQSVTYHLDENFYQPQVTVRSKDNAFQLELNTLNHIPVTADIYFKDGKITKLDQYVLLGTRRQRQESSYKVHMRHVILKTPDETKNETEYELDLLIDAPENDLKQIDHVDYYFSEPSPNKMVKIDKGTPDFKYHIKTSQQIIVQGYAYFKDGSVIQMIGFLYFKYY